MIISLYGYKYSNNLEAVIKSINEQTIDTEVIVSEQGENVSSVFKGIAKKMGAKYLLTKPEYRDGKMNFNIGKVRNAGASIATGEYLYFNDADVLMCNKKFLESILVEMQNRPQISMCRPLIYRLSMETSQMFIDDYLKNIDMVFKINNKDACLVEYCDGFLGAIKGGEVHELINGMPHVCTQYNNEDTGKCRSMAAVMLFLRQTTGKTERYTHFCMPLKAVFTRDCGNRVHFTDEPTGALNRTSSDEVMEELAKLNSEGTTIMLVTHDVKVASKCTRVMYIVDGNIKGEYDLSDCPLQMRERERALNNWLLELGW